MNLGGGLFGFDVGLSKFCDKSVYRCVILYVWNENDFFRGLRLKTLISLS